MRRRDVITLASGATLAWLPFARAQQSSHKMWRLAFLNTDSWESEVQRALFEVFRDELRKLGYVDGKNLVIERRAAEGHFERLDPLTGRLRTCLEPQDGCRTWIEYSGCRYCSCRQGNRMMAASGDVPSLGQSGWSSICQGFKSINGLLRERPCRRRRVSPISPILLPPLPC
jgi:hypothetical protein